MMHPSAGSGPTASPARNVLGGELESCSLSPLTGFYRTGCCDTGSEDLGVHTVCAQVTEEFLAFSQARGNDLSTPNPDFGFGGLGAGDRWCLCASRWLEAWEAGVAPPVFLAGTHEATLAVMPIELLLDHALDAPTH